MFSDQLFLRTPLEGCFWIFKINSKDTSTTSINVAVIFSFLSFFLSFFFFSSETYSETCQTSKKGLFCENSQQLKIVSYFAKKSILDVWLGSEYTSVVQINEKKVTGKSRLLVSHTAWKVFFLVRIFLYLDWIRRFTE